MKKKIVIVFVLTQVGMLTLHGIQPPQPTKFTDSYLVIDSVRNNTQMPITLYDGTTKIIEIPAGQKIYLTRSFILQAHDNDFEKTFRINGNNSHAQIIIIQRPRNNRTYYGYIIYKKMPAPMQKQEKMEFARNLGRENHLSMTINGTTTLESIKLKVKIETAIGKQIETEKE